MTEYKLKAETDNNTIKGGNVSMRVKRGEKSNSYFIVVYNILLTLSVGVISVIPNRCINWTVKIFLFFIVAFLLVRCFRVNKFRNFVLKIFSKIENYEEVS